MKKGYVRKLSELALLIVSLFAGTLYAQEKSTFSIREFNRNTDKIMNQSNQHFYFIEDEQIVDSKDQPMILKSQKPFMGVYTEELTMSKIRELDYKNNFGIIITGVTKGSPAYNYNLLKDDIIMYMGETKIVDKNIFLKTIDQYNVGDSINIKVFRLGQERTMPFVFGARKSEITININKDVLDSDIESVFDNDVTFDDTPSKQKAKKSHSTGYGGGTWMPIWTMINMDDVNDLITRLKFNKLDDNGILLNGGGGKGPIGDGLFIGGMGAGYSIDRKVNTNIPNNSTPSSTDSINVQRRMIYNNYFWAVTLDKRFAITRNFIASLGFGIGTAGQSIEISQSGETLNWDNMEDQITHTFNSYANLSKDYIVVHPKMELMYRLNSWLGIRAEGGFVYGYSWHNNWKNTVVGETYEVSGNDINTKYQGYTVSIGPWFGF